MSTGDSSQRGPEPSSWHVVAPWAAVAFVAAMLPESLRPFRAGFDDAFILQAARNLALGNFFGHSWHDELHDLARARLTYVGVDWPPGYPLIIVALMKAGLSVESAARAVQLAAAAIGVAGWLRFAARTLRGLWLHLFACWVLVVFFADRAAQSNLLLWALVPYILTRLVTAVSGAARPADAWKLGLLVAAAVLVRYNAVFLIGGAAFGILLLSKSALRVRVALAAAATAPGVAMLLLLFAINRNLAHQASFTSSLPSGLFPEALFEHSVPVRALFAYAFGLERVGSRLTSKFPLKLLWLSGTAVAIALIAVGARALRAYRAQPDALQRDTSLAVAILLGCLFALLALLTIRHGAITDPAVNMNRWTFLGQPRYFSELVPAVCLIWLIAFQRCWPVPRAGVRSIAVGAALLISTTYTLLENVGGSRIAHRLRGTIYGQDVDTLQARVSDLVATAGDRATIVLDEGYSLPFWRTGLRVALFPAPRELPAIVASAPVRVIAIVSPQPKTPERGRAMAATIAYYGLREVGQVLRRDQPLRVYVADLPAFGPGMHLAERYAPPREQ